MVLVFVLFLTSKQFSVSLVRDRNEKVIQVTISETVLGLRLICPESDSKIEASEK